MAGPKRFLLHAANHETDLCQSSHRIGCLLVLVLVQRAQGFPAQLQITHGIVALDGLVQVGVKGHLLDILLLAQFHKTLTGSIAGVKDLLQQIQDQIGWAVLAIPLTKVLHQIGLIDHAGALLGVLHDGLCAHATALGGEVDAFTGALGHVARCITHQDGTILHTPRPRVLRDRMRLHPDDVATLNAGGCSVADALLVLLDALLVHHRAGAHGHMVTLGEDPGIEVRRHILAHVHLGPLLVVIHLLLRDLHSLLEGNGIFVVSSFDIFGHPAVGAIGPNHHIHLQGLLHTFSGVALLVLVVVVGQHVGIALLLWQSHAHEETIDQGGAVLLGALTEEVIQHFTTHHSDELVILQSLANLDLLVGGRDHRHLSHLAVNNVFWQVELINHAQGNGPAAWLAVVHFPFDEESLHSILGQLICCAGPCRATPHHSHTELAALGEVDASTDHHLGVAQGSAGAHWDDARPLPTGQAASTAAAGRGGGQTNSCEAAGREAGAVGG
mmetsp:Transcript_76284/g.120466  ORF Transcript_76284/g.120466 Transcript_76284/m.120466 type:complete len:499 (-) Transcript_76284:183-1679(-)